MAYQEYPKVMTHPGYRPAIVDMTNPKAAVYPPVTVLNEEQEGRHRALGYEAPEGDPSAHDTAAPQPHEYEFQEYPKWVGDVEVFCAEEEAALSGEETAASDDRAALRAEYEKLLGKKPFAGWSAEVLTEKIEAARVPA